MKVQLQQFRGMAPSVAPSVLPDLMATFAQNCHLEGGSIRPMQDVSVGAALTKGAGVKSIYPYDGTWFNWLADVQCVRSPIAQDVFDRRYWTGDGAPKMTAQGIATGGADYPSGWYALGIPTPPAAPLVAAVGTPTTSDVLDMESRIYVYTYVSSFGEEGPPSDPSELVDVAPGQYVAISSMAGEPVGDYDIVAKNIYRTNTGSSDTAFQFVDTVPVATTACNDETLSSALNEVLPSQDWDMPPAELQGLISLPFGSLAGFYNNILCLSVPYMPHAWPASYQISLEDTIVAIGSYGNSILVVTEGAPCILTGNTPVAMTVERLEQGYACVSKRGFVDVGYACIYPAINGLMMVGMQGAKLVSDQLLTQRDWLAYGPHTIRACLHDGKYVAFWDAAVSKGFIYDPSTNDLILHDIPATAAYHDPGSGSMYIADAGYLKQWEGSTGNKTATWTSKRFDLQYNALFGAAQVLASDYPVTFSLYLDDTLFFTKTVLNANPFRLPGGKRAMAMSVELSGAHTIDRVVLATTMAELQG